MQSVSTAQPPEPPPGTLSRLLSGVTTRLARGEKLFLDVFRAEKLDGPFKNRMYTAYIDLSPNDPAQRIRWLGRGLDAAGKPFVNKSGGSYIRLTNDKRQSGVPEAVEVTNGRGDKDFRQVGFFLLFARPNGQYAGEFYTGVPEHPLIRLLGTKITTGTAFIRCDLSLAPANVKSAFEKPRVHVTVHEPPQPSLHVVASDAPPPRFNW